MNVYEFLNNPSTAVFNSPYIVFDAETTNRNYGDSTKRDNHLVLSCWKERDSSVTLADGGYDEKLQALMQRIEEEDVILVGHNIKFDLRWLARYGLDLSKVMVWDTMIAEHVFYGNRPPNIKIGLGPTAERYGYPTKEPYIDLCMKGGVCPSELPRSLLERRCKYDVAVTEGVFLQQIERARKEDKLKTMLTRFLLTPVLADIETNGLFLDPEKVRMEYFRALKEQERVSNFLTDIADINWNSTQQIAGVLYDQLGIKELLDSRKNPIRTAGGKPKADVATIRKLKGRNKQQRTLLSILSERSVVEAELSKTLSKFKECVDNEDLLYAQFNQAVTQTHRLSSSGTEYGVQFQNMPRKFKPCITARYPNWKVREDDGAQLEFRVAACLGQDEQAIYDIVHDVDIHSYTAKTITEAGQDTDRQGAKAHTFKPLIIAA